MSVCCYSVSYDLEPGCDDTAAGFFADAFGEDALSFSAKKNRADTGDEYWAFLWIFANEPDRIFLENGLDAVFAAAGLGTADYARLVVDSVEDRDWLAESYRALPPIQAGPFFIYGSHFDGAPPADKIPLLIEAATAFGSGEHGTTSECLIALSYLKDQGVAPGTVLDMGCGSGILAAAAAKLWPDARTFAADNDPECIRVSTIHFSLNAVESIESFVSDGYEGESAVWNAAPYELVIANILAGPLIDMAADQSRAIGSSGHIILSGTLAGEQEARVQKAYEYQGLTLVRTFYKDEWATLLMRKII